MFESTRGPLRIKLIAIADRAADLDHFATELDKQHRAWARWGKLRNDTSQSIAKQHFMPSFWTY
eukprot:15463747-Alexandrium_andersonii.AAC.1